MAKNKNTGKGKVAILTLLLLIITGIICYGLIPLFNSIHLGLDLNGGFEILYEVESLDGSDVTDAELTSTRKTLSRRIDGLGVTEPNIEVSLPNRIRIGLAGITSPEEARNMLGKTANLTFRDVNDNLLMDASVLESGSASIGQGNTPGSIAVVLTIKDIDKFYEVTNKISQMSAGENLIVTWLDFEEGVDTYKAYEGTCNGENGINCISAASVSEGLASRNVTIEGSFTEKEANNLKELINSGSLPTKLTEISSKTVSAAFGIDSLNKTLTAGIIGILLIIMINKIRLNNFALFF